MDYSDNSRQLGKLLASMIVLLLFLFGAVIILGGDVSFTLPSCESTRGSCAVSCQEGEFSLPPLDVSCEESTICCHKYPW